MARAKQINLDGTTIDLGAAPSSSTPAMDGTAAVGTSTAYARGDHVHPTDTSRQASITGGASTITSSNLTASRALVSNSSGKVAVSDVTSTELGYLDGVTSAIQTQLNNKLNKTLSDTSVALMTDGNGNIVASQTSAAQLEALRTLDTTSTIQTQIDGKAAKNHQSTTTDYGVGTSAAYGHLKIANNLTTASFDAADPVALSAYQGKTLKDSVDGKAPTSHASSATTYGIGTSANYGHLKIANNLTESSFDAAAPVALSAYQGKVLKDAVDGKAPTNHLSSSSDYGVGSGTQYGHCKTINNLTTASYSAGDALAAYQGKVLQDNIDKVSPTLPAIGTSDASSKSVATNTNVNLGSISLTPGLWLIVVTARWSSNANGARQLWLSTTSTGDAKDYASMVSQRPVSGAITMMQLVVFASVSSNTTYYIVGKQTVGSSTSLTIDVRHSTARLGDVPSS